MNPFSLLVKPTSSDCNLRCEYCFYLCKSSLYPKTGKHRMSDRVLEQMIKSFMATEQVQYSIGWQGGEPTLMGLDFFKRVTELEEKYGRRGVMISNGLQTNGTLIDDDFAKHLAKYSFLVGVSLDGPAEIHNHYRKYVDGRASHTDVMRGIELFRKHNVEFNTLTLVNNLTAGKGKEIYTYFRDNEFLFQQYIECVEYDEAGKLMPYSVSSEAWGDFLCEVYDEWIKDDTRRVSVRLFDSILVMMVEGVANVCHMGRDCRQYFLVEYNGDVYPCDFFAEPELKLGNVMGDSWKDFLGSETYGEFGSQKTLWNSACDTCEYLGFCGGGCLKNRFHGDDRDSRQLSELCKGWKQFFRHALPGVEKLAEEIKRERKGSHMPVSAFTNVGRNDPCPCGSGRKYKRCCLLNRG